MRPLIIAACLLLVCSARAFGDSQATIYWDTWGVPHIEATDDRALMYAFGEAQMRAR